MSDGARRQLLKLFAGLLATGAISPAQAAQVLAVRVWPARDYTRVTLELDEQLITSHELVPDPPRLVVDLEGVRVDSRLRELVAKIEPNDPYIAGVRIGQFQPNVTRVVFDLKETISPQVFGLLPYGDYQHRLVLDLYPRRAPDPLADVIGRPRDAEKSGSDPLASIIDSRLRSPAPGPSRRLPKPVTIAIDPGHGGEDPGAVGQAGTLEKDVVLAVSRALRDRINATPGMRAIMTREGDYFVPLARRVAKARAARADLLVSIHADAFVQPHAHGSSVFVLSDGNATSSGARWLAQRENRADRVGGINLAARDQEVARVLLDLSTTAQIRESRRLGQTVLQQLRTVGRLHKPRVEEAGFAVLRAPDVPSILVEVAFISNPVEEARLRNPAHQQRVADALHAGIRRHLGNRASA